MSITSYHAGIETSPQLYFLFSNSDLISLLVGCQSKVTFMSEPVAQCWQLFSRNFYNLVPRRQQQRGVSRCIVYHFCHTAAAVSSRTPVESEWTAHQLNCKWQHHLSPFGLQLDWLMLRGMRQKGEWTILHFFWIWWQSSVTNVEIKVNKMEIDKSTYSKSKKWCWHLNGKWQHHSRFFAKGPLGYFGSDTH